MDTSALAALTAANFGATEEIARLNWGKELHFAVS